MNSIGVIVRASQFLGISFIASMLFFTHTAAMAQAGQKAFTTAAAAVSHCTAKTLALEATYASLMAGDQVKALERLKEMESAGGVATMEQLRANIEASKPTSFRDVSAMAAKGMYGPCLVQHNINAERKRAEACYSYLDLVRIVYKYKGQGAEKIIKKVGPEEARLIPATATRAAGSNLDPVQFEIRESLICLGLPDKIFQ